MQIDITKLLTNSVSIIKINGEIIIPKEIMNDSRIDDLKDIKIDGNLTINEEDELELNANLKGTMSLKDDITLEPVDYNFDTEVEETLELKQNMLDITDVLWQNIVVEIPSKVHKTDEITELSGNGWRVISEETFNEERNRANNPFQNLSELLETKEDK